jgi:light-regulated signal transduction histidine kinase (bacteriophytochrome)
MTTNPGTALTDAMCTEFEPLAKAAMCGATPADSRPDYVALAHVNLHRTPLDLAKMAEARIEHLRELEPDRQVEVIVHPTMLATGDPALLAEALAQLIDNAWRSTAETRNAWIEIGTRVASDGERQFYVSDNGSGFEMALVGTLLEPQMSRFREESISGYGNGLARAARIIRRHAGRLQADSAPGKGAELFFTLG